MLVPGRFSYLLNYNSNWKKILGFRNLQEKLENLLTKAKETIKHLHMDEVLLGEIV